MNKQERYRLKHREKGLCVGCPNPAIIGQVLCVKCSEKRIARHKRSMQDPAFVESERQRSQTRREQMKEGGRCHKCGAPLGNDKGEFSTCMNCRQKAYLPRGANRFGVYHGTDNQERDAV